MTQCVRYAKDITIVECGTYDMEFTWSSGIAPADPVRMHIYGYSGIMQGRLKLSDELPLIDLPNITDPWSADGISGIYVLDDDVTEDRFGVWKIYINDQDTKNLCARHKKVEGSYSLFLYNTLGEAVLNQYGVMNIEPSAART